MDINTIISDYLREKATADAAKKRADALKEKIMDACGPAGHIVTDAYIVTVKETEGVRLDTGALYKDFPDIKDVYSRRTISRSVTVAAITDAEKRA